MAKDIIATVETDHYVVLRELTDPRTGALITDLTPGIAMSYRLELNGTLVAGQSGPLTYNYDGPGSWFARVQLPTTPGTLHVHVEATDTASASAIERWHGTIRAKAFG